MQKGYPAVLRDTLFIFTKQYQSQRYRKTCSDTRPLQAFKILFPLSLCFFVIMSLKPLGLYSLSFTHSGKKQPYNAAPEEQIPQAGIPPQQRNWNKEHITQKRKARVISQRRIPEFLHLCHYRYHLLRHRHMPPVQSNHKTVQEKSQSHHPQAGNPVISYEKNRKHTIRKNQRKPQPSIRFSWYPSGKRKNTGLQKECPTRQP